VRGGGPSDVWASGQQGALIHWDGKAWSHVASGTDNVLYGLWVGAGGDAWLVGEGSTILRRVP